MRWKKLINELVIISKMNDFKKPNEYNKWIHLYHLKKKKKERNYSTNFARNGQH